MIALELLTYGLLFTIIIGVNLFLFLVYLPTLKKNKDVIENANRFNRKWR